MDLNLLRSAVTVAGLLLFAVLAVWAWWPSRRSAFERAARAPFDGEVSE
jgi:cbb3-type cytochrome oxidase subunit 3